VIWDYPKRRVLGKKKGILKHIVVGKVRGAIGIL